MGDITGLLERWAGGDRESFERLMPLVYDELRQLAAQHLRNERTDHTLQPTALVHEAYLRLAGIRELRMENRAHFFGAAAAIMRRILVDHARQRLAQKRGGGERVAIPFAEPYRGSIDERLDFVALDEAMVALEQTGPLHVRVVELRYFAGLSIQETGECLGIAPATVKRHWAFARAWLLRRLSGT